MQLYLELYKPVCTCGVWVSHAATNARTLRPLALSFRQGLDQALLRCPRGDVAPRASSSNRLNIYKKGRRTQREQNKARHTKPQTNGDAVRAAAGGHGVRHGHARSHPERRAVAASQRVEQQTAAARRGSRRRTGRRLRGALRGGARPPTHRHKVSDNRTSSCCGRVSLYSTLYNYATRDETHTR